MLYESDAISMFATSRARALVLSRLETRSSKLIGRVGRQRSWSWPCMRDDNDNNNDDDTDNGGGGPVFVCY